MTMATDPDFDKFANDEEKDFWKAVYVSHVQNPQANGGRADSFVNRAVVRLREKIAGPAED